MQSCSSSARAIRLAITVVIISLSLASLRARANDRAWQVLANFAPNVSPRDDSPLVEGTSGDYFGTTVAGGTNASGDVFEITSSGQWTELYSFAGGNDGSDPIGGLTPGGDTYFYGVTSFGGTNGAGTVFKITPGSALTPLYSFTNGVDGAVPNAGLVHGPGGLFYGTTYYGGSNGFGGVFSVTSAGQLTVLYSFTNGADGLNVSTVLAVGQDGDLYGASQYGGSTNNAGTIFKITTAGALTVLYTFTNGADGAFPNGGLAMDGLGNFYGTAAQGGAYANGLAFMMTPSGSLTVLYPFTGGLDGSTPGAPLAAGNDGDFYGTTLYSGQFFGGTAFQLTTSGTVTTLVRFNAAASGSAPGALIQGSDTNFYGLSIYGGSNGDGTIFKFSSSVSQPGLSNQIPSSELSALTDLYNSTEGGSWNQRSGWLDSNADYWYGVTVSPLQYDAAWNLLAPSHVADLGLSFNNMFGSIPDSIGNLPSLQEFLVNNNGLSGTIPASLTSLTRLQWASLSWNSLSGGLPPGMENLTQLTNFTVNVNQLTNGIPPALGNLSLLQYLDLSYNPFGGAIPQSLGNLTNLQFLYLGQNGLTGGLPDTLTNLTLLQALAVNGNLLTGPIPDGIGVLTQLTYLDLSYNILSGSIPASIGNLGLLQNLYLQRNALTGSLPDNLTNLVSLQWLDISGNALSGSLPDGFGNLGNLNTFFSAFNSLGPNIPDSLTNLVLAQTLDLSWNQFSNGIPQGIGNLANLLSFRLNDNSVLSGPIPDSLTNCLLLQLVDFSWNSLSGAIPDGVTNLTQLQNLYLNINQLTGSIPAGIGSLTNVQNLSFAGNMLTGAIPPGIGNLTQMAVLDLDYNQLSGPIPDVFGGLTNFQGIYLYVNALTGGIPPSLSTCSNLQFIDLSWNNLTGGIPDSLTSLPALQVLNLQENNSLGGGIPLGLGNLARLQTVNLGWDGLSGSLPDSLTNLTMLNYIDLDNNGLSGPLPAGIGNLTALQNLYLYANQLSGAIPGNLGDLTNLQNVILFSNYLDGPLPLFSAGYIDLTWNDLLLDTNSTDYNVVQDMIASGQTVNYLPQNIPTVLGEPSDLRLAAGQSAVFNAAIVNASSVQWFFSGQLLTNSSSVSGAQTTSLTVSDAQSINDGGYNLIASNSFGSATTLVAILTITNSAPIFFTTNGLLYSNGQFHLQISGLTGQGPVVIAASANLTQWTPIFTNPSAFGSIQFTDSNAAGFPHRYYRASVPP